MMRTAGILKKQAAIPAANGKGVAAAAPGDSDFGVREHSSQTVDIDRHSPEGNKVRSKCVDAFEEVVA